MQAEGKQFHITKSFFKRNPKPLFSTFKTYSLLTEAKDCNLAPL